MTTKMKRGAKTGKPLNVGQRRHALQAKNNEGGVVEIYSAYVKERGEPKSTNETLP